MFSMSSRRSRIGATLAASALLAAGAGWSGTTAAARDSQSAAERTYNQMAKPTDSGPAKIRLDLLAINDFHGNLEPIPSTSSSGRINNTAAGGAEYLARHLKNLRHTARANGARTITVAAGDLIGASPLLSAAFHDEPTIEAMNKMGLQVASVGNHEFDEGYKELLRMQRGGCLRDGPEGRNNQNSCPDSGHRFKGADFQYLSANVKWANQGNRNRSTVFPATKIINVHGVKVGFIGMTLQDTPNIVTKSGVEGLKFTAEVRTANRLVPVLRNKGVKAIVVLLHQGAVPTDSTAYDSCTGATGPALDIAKNLRPAIDVVISGHTHQAYNCTVRDPLGQPRLLTSASSFGRLVTDVHLLLDPLTRDVVRPAEYAQNRIVTNSDGTRPVQSLTDLIALYKNLVADIENEVIGHLAEQPADPDIVTRDPDADGSGDSELGNLIADGQLADPSSTPPGPGGSPAQIALMNPGGIRADLVENEAGEITYGTAFSVQPFNNYVDSLDLTGQQLLDVLNEQWNGDNEEFNKILQVSGLTYTWDKSLAAEDGADAVVVGTVRVGDDLLVPGETYRVVMNSFLSDGGDGFATLAEGQNKYRGGLDIDSLSMYLKANDPYTVTATDRIDAQD